MTASGGGADYQLAWPRLLFQAETAALLNSLGKVRDWDDRCELLLEDAFVGVAPRDDFLATVDVERRSFLVHLLRRAPSLKEAATGRSPYWSERQRSRRPGAPALGSTVREFIRIVNELEGRGYFEKAFGKDCVDDPRTSEPSAFFERELDVADLWPLHPVRLTDDRDLFCDVIEVLHDLVARPRHRQLHNYAGCGWHHSDFSIEAGQVLYR